MEWAVKYIAGVFIVMIIEWDPPNWNLLLTNCPNLRCPYPSYFISTHLNDDMGIKEGDRIYLRGDIKCHRVSLIEEVGNIRSSTSGFICNATL